MTSIAGEWRPASSDAELLLALLNSAPVVDGMAQDALQGDGARAFAERLDGTGSHDELSALRSVRGLLWRLVRQEPVGATELDAPLDGVALIPRATAEGLAWELEGPSDSVLAARAFLAWADVVAHQPGRLRACANTECNLFLLDRSRPGTARWCSMATCGNRMKARAHAARRR